MLITLALPCEAAVSLRIGQNFTASQSGVDSSAIPMDANGAVGPSHFVEFINDRYSVYNKSSGQRVQTMTDVTFWSKAGVSLSRTLATTDPRLVFDFDTQRWFASCIDFSPAAPRQTQNRFLVAVSASPDPTGLWHGFAFTADPVSGDFADFPTLGVDRDAIYLGGDLYTPKLGLHIGSTLVALPKTGLLASSPSIDGRTSFGSLAFNSHGQILQPAVTMGRASSGESVLAVGNLGLDGKPHSTLVMTVVENKSATNSQTITVPEYTFPSGLLQPDGSTNLDAGDARFSGAVRRVGDVLYAVHAVDNGVHNAVRWYKISATGLSLLESGTIADPNLDLSYPSIAANEAGAVVIACNGSGANTFISCYAVAGETVNGSLQFGELLLLKAGVASYRALDPSGTSRWGDFSATTLDPTDPNRFWTIQAYPTGKSSWATQITELLIMSMRLAVVANGPNLEISWPASLDRAQLQYASSLSPVAQWVTVTQAPVVAAGLATVTLPASAIQGYYRLMQ